MCKTQFFKANKQQKSDYGAIEKRNVIVQRGALLRNFDRNTEVLLSNRKRREKDHINNNIIVIVKQTRNHMLKILQDRFCRNLLPSSLCKDGSNNNNNPLYIKKIEQILFNTSKNNLIVYADERTLDDRLRKIMTALLRRRLCQSYKSKKICL